MISTLQPSWPNLCYCQVHTGWIWKRLKVRDIIYMNSVLYSFRKFISFIWLLVKQLSKPTPYDYLQNRYKVNKKFKKYILNEIYDVHSYIHSFRFIWTLPRLSIQISSGGKEGATNVNPNKTGLLKLVERHHTPQKNTLECLSPPQMYMVGDIHIQTLNPEGQTSSQGP